MSEADTETPAPAVRSMTGYGAAEGELASGRVSVTARSINHRYLDLGVSLPRRMAGLEPRLKQLFQGRLARGRVEVFVRAVLEPGEGAKVVVGRALASEVVSALRELRDAHALADDPTLSDLARFPGVLEVQEAEAETDDDTAERVVAVAARALDELVRMRESEGARLATALRGILDEVEACADRIESLARGERALRRETLRGRVGELVGELGLDEGRLYQEVVRLVDRSEIQEELERLRSHVAQARERLAEGTPCGKPLDFLTQELMREANTMGSKSGSAPLTQVVVALKGEIEKFREQVQNVE